MRLAYEVLNLIGPGFVNVHNGCQGSALTDDAIRSWALALDLQPDQAQYAGQQEVLIHGMHGRAGVPWQSTPAEALPEAANTARTGG